MTKRHSGIMTPIMALAFYGIASGYLMSVLPLTLSTFGLSTTLVSWLASIYYAGLLIGTLYAERVLRVFGHKKSFSLFLAAFTLSVIMLPLFPTATMWLSIRFIQGIAVGGIFVSIESWLLFGDEAGRAKRLSFYLCAFYASTSLGQLGLHFSFSNSLMPFIYSIGILIIATAIIVFGRAQQPTLTTTTDDSAESKPVSLKLINKMNHSAIIGCLVSGMVLGVIYGLMPVALKLKHISSSDIGNLMALVILGAMLVQPIVSMLSKYLGRTLLIGMCCFVGASSSVIFTMSDSLLMLSVSLFVLGMAAFAIYPVALNLGSQTLQPAQITTGSKIMLLCSSIGNVMGPLGANCFSSFDDSVMDFLFTILLSTCIYMLIVSLGARRQWATPK